MERMSRLEFKKLIKKGALKVESIGKQIHGYGRDNPASGNKYRNRIVQWSGIRNGSKVCITFQSQKERDRAIYLFHREKSGAIKELDLQKSFVLIPKLGNERPITYRADFFYHDNELNEWIVEDTKSPITRKEPRYIIKRKLFKWFYRKFKFVES